MPVKGQIIISLLSRDAITGCGNPLAIVGPAGDVRGPDDDEMIVEQRNSLPEGWEERKTGDGRVYFVNHVTKTTQWSRPTQPASMIQLTNTATSNVKNATENNSLTPPGPSRSTTMNNLEQSPPSGPLNEVPLVPLVVATTQDNRRHSNENLIAEIITDHISSSSSNNSIESNEVGKVETPNQNLSPTTVTSISSPRNSVLITNSQLINTLSNNLGTLTIDNVVDNSSNNHHNTNDNANTVAADESTISNSTTTLNSNNNIRINNDKTTNNFSSSTTTTTQQVPKNQTTNTTTLTTTAAANAQTNERQESIVTTESQPATPQRIHQPQPQQTTPSSNEVINRHASDQGKFIKH